MNAQPTTLLDQPDPRVRPQKAAWRQLRGALTLGIADVIREQSCEPTDISLIGSDGTLAAAVSMDLGRRVVVPSDSPVMRDDIVAVTLPEIGSPESRIGLLTSAFERTRPTGGIVVAATVVARSGENPRRTPNISQLLEEINITTGTAIHVDAIQSIRWADEPFVRGVILTLTSLRTWKGKEA